MANRIEEVAKLLFERDCPDGDWGCAVPMQKEKWLKDARQICQLFPQPLDDKELEKALRQIKIALLTNFNTGKLSDEGIWQILALLQLKMEEARRQIIKTLSEYTEGDIYGDAKTEDYMLFQILVKVWQALKGGV